MVGPWFYAGSFLLFLVAFPPIMVASQVAGDNTSGPLYLFTLVLSGMVDLGVLAFVWNRCSLPVLSFWDSLRIISSRYMSGCGNITIIYIYPVLAAYYAVALYHSLLSISLGPDHARMKWFSLVTGFPTPPRPAPASTTRNDPFYAEPLASERLGTPTTPNAAATPGPPANSSSPASQRTVTAWLPLVAVLTFFGIIVLIAGTSNNQGGSTPTTRSAAAWSVPSRTLRPPTAAPVRASPTPSCLPWWSITLSDVGSHRCIFGDVRLTYDDAQAYYVTFGPDESDFYILLYDIDIANLPNLRIGDCVMVEGQLDQLVNAPVIVIRWASDIHNCP